MLTSSVFFPISAPSWCGIHKEPPIAIASGKSATVPAMFRAPPPSTNSLEVLLLSATLPLRFVTFYGSPISVAGIFGCRLGSGADFTVNLLTTGACPCLSPMGPSRRPLRRPVLLSGWRLRQHPFAQALILGNSALLK